MLSDQPNLAKEFPFTITNANLKFAQKLIPSFKKNLDCYYKVPDIKAISYYCPKGRRP